MSDPGGSQRSATSFCGLGADLVRTRCGPRRQLSVECLRATFAQIRPSVAALDAADPDAPHTSRMDQHQSVEDVLRNYRDTLLAMHECRAQSQGDTRRWNVLVDRMQTAHLALRKSIEGRDGITALISHDCLTVRQWSATNALAWAPLEGRFELEREVNDGGVGSLEAKVTLQEFDAGRLNTVWAPKD